MTSKEHVDWGLSYIQETYAPDASEATPTHDAVAGKHRLLTALEADADPQRSALLDFLDTHRLGSAVAALTFALGIVAVVVQGGWL